MWTRQPSDHRGGEYWRDGFHAVRGWRDAFHHIRWRDAFHRIPPGPGGTGSSNASVAAAFMPLDLPHRAGCPHQCQGARTPRRKVQQALAGLTPPTRLGGRGPFGGLSPCVFAALRLCVELPGLGEAVGPAPEEIKMVEEGAQRQARELELVPGRVGTPTVRRRTSWCLRYWG